MNLEIIGWIGSVCFSICAIPQSYRSWKDGHSEGISMLFLWLWFVGEATMIIYGFAVLKNLPVLTNYIVNFICLLIIMKFKYWRRN